MVLFILHTRIASAVFFLTMPDVSRDNVMSFPHCHVLSDLSLFAAIGGMFAPTVAEIKDTNKAAGADYCIRSVDTTCPVHFQALMRMQTTWGVRLCHQVNVLALNLGEAF